MPRNRPAERVAGADVAQISGAVAGRNVQGPAERDRQTRIVAANPATFLVGFRGCPRHPRVLVTEIDALIADRLDARPTGHRIFEKSPSQVQQSIAVAETTREKEDECDRPTMSLRS
jgi:hypothetical protein